MKVKKDPVKMKKKKNKLQTTANPSIKKIKKNKVKKVENDSEVAETVKKGFEESQKEAGSSTGRQETWNAYLKVFLASEKLNKKQKLIMEFCTNKGLTPPRRKQKFLNFIRNCYVHQKDVSDELCFELFDSIHKKYDDFKSGKYSSDDNVVSADEPSTAKPSKNKKKKLNRSANNDSNNSSPGKTASEKWEKIKSKKRKQPKVPSDSSEDDEEDVETDDE